MKPAAVRRVSRVLRRMVLISRCTGFAAPDLVALVGHLQHRGGAHHSTGTIVLTVLWRPSLLSIGPARSAPNHQHSRKCALPNEIRGQSASSGAERVRRLVSLVHRCTWIC